MATTVNLFLSVKRLNQIRLRCNQAMIKAEIRPGLGSLFSIRV